MLTDELEVIFSSNGYIEYQKGNMSLIACIPHGGHQQSSASKTKKAWEKYHNFISRAIEDIKEKHRCGLLIDLHEHDQSENIELGYMLSKEELMLSDEQINQSPSVQTEFSIKNLYLYHKESLSFAELLCGKFNSLGGKLQSYSYETTSSHINQYPKDEKYFFGGYTIKKYKLFIDAIQI
ncbi:28473_t:CDS:2, partial [Racocetra persica]